MTTIKAKRYKVIFENEENGFGIYICQTDNGGYVTVKGNDIPDAGCCWICMTGEWIKDERYGKEFKVWERIHGFILRGRTAMFTERGCRLF